MEKPKLVKTDLDKKIKELVIKSDHKILGIWAADCAERVLPYFEEKYPKDDRPRKAIEDLRKWVKTDIFKMTNIREGSLAAHAAAREADEGSAALSAARAAGQALATAHVSTHSIAAAVYAATAIRDEVKAADADADVAVMKERNWQYQHLLDLSK